MVTLASTVIEPAENVARFEVVETLAVDADLTNEFAEKFEFERYLSEAAPSLILIALPTVCPIAAVIAFAFSWAAFIAIARAATRSSISFDVSNFTSSISVGSVERMSLKIASKDSSLVSLNVTERET